MQVYLSGIRNRRLITSSVKCYCNGLVYGVLKGKGSGDRKDEGGSSGKHFCHVCNINCRNDDDFRGHMNSARHKKRMMDVLSVHKEKSTQLAARMKAEEHLRKIEVKEKNGYVVKLLAQVLV